ncbi:MAG: RHS repeat-associated core domain-containing protein [Planctomycetota bacterium]
MTSITTIEKSDTGATDEVFVTTCLYDALDRRTEIMDNVGNTTQYGYNSRDNRTLEVDALGNQVRYEYDGLNRITRTIHDMDGDGASAADPADMVTYCTYDDSSRMTSRTDDNGNTSTYDHDALGRLIGIMYADGTMKSLTYDVHGNVVEPVDPNGTLVVYGHDLDKRLVSKTVTPGPGVSNETTFEALEYDGLTRLVSAIDDDSTVTRSYDSLGHVTQEILNGLPTTREYDAVGNVTRCTYAGGRTIETTYDDLERKKTISDASSGIIASYDYIGPLRVERRVPGNGVESVTEFDGARRITRTTHTFDRGGVGTVLDDRSYAWDPVYSKTARMNLMPGGTDFSLEYDARYRLVRATVTDTNGSEVIDYNLDGAGNRTSVVGGPGAGPYWMDPTTPEPADFQEIQYSTTPADSRMYDANGNLIDIDTSGQVEMFSWNYNNRLVGYQNLSTGVSATYRYDALGRRIERSVTDGTTQTTRYSYDLNRFCEEYDEGAGIQASYVYGLYVDEVLTMQRGGMDYYYLADDLHNVTVVTDAVGTPLERYEYGVYGKPKCFDGAGTPIAGSAIGNPYLFTGRQYDPETELYYYRSRYLDPAAGRFISRDAIGMWGDGENVDNGYTYAGNNPWSAVDPYTWIRATTTGSGPERRTIDGGSVSSSVAER